MKLVFLAYRDIYKNGRNQYQTGLKLSPSFPLFLKTDLVDISGEIVYNGLRKKDTYTKLGTVSKFFLLRVIGRIFEFHHCFFTHNIMGHLPL